ncbi:MAG: PQQ-dependent sugar dehydrogenase [Geminicoccaceae bacterium]
MARLPLLKPGLGLALVAGLIACTEPGRAPVADQVFESDATSFRLVTVARALANPWGMAFLPDGSALVTERDGRLRLLDADGVLQDAPIAGVPEVWARGQGGLLDVAVHPDFASNGWVYLSYSEPGDGGASTAVARGTFTGDALADVTVIWSDQPKSGGGRHFGSRLAFAPDGTLIVTLGDRGERWRAQDANDPTGGTLRLNDDGSIPADNPFAAGGGHPALFTIGNRNVQGLAIHPETGAIWTQEHGPRGGDEVNILEPGANYGWPVVTHGEEYAGGSIGEGTSKPGLVDPLHVWVPSIAPSGLTFYDGAALPAWQGDLFVGALKYQLLVRLELDGTEIVHEERLLEDEIGRIRDVVQGPDGLLYLLTDEAPGGVYRIEPVEAS